jgi:phosphatidylserine decarboxylase
MPALGFVLSLLVMAVAASKWRLPKRQALYGALIVSAAVALLFFWIGPKVQTRAWQAGTVAAQVVLSLGVALAALLLRFWRDPERIPPHEQGVVLSASDGKVIYVRTVAEGSSPLVTKGNRDYLLSELTGTHLLSSRAYVIGVDMSLMDVHVTRCPIAGQVTLQKRIKGRFISLRNDEAPFVNERVTTVIDGGTLSAAVVQVASRLVRSVESYRREGEAVGIGERLGMIRIGSLVAVVLPQREGVQIVVRPGERVTAGVSVVARYQFSE